METEETKSPSQLDLGLGTYTYFSFLVSYWNDRIHVYNGIYRTGTWRIKSTHK